MARSLRCAAVFVAAVLLAAGSGFAAYDAFLRVPGMAGDSMNPMHPGAQGWIHIESFSWGVGRGFAAAPPPGKGPGRLTIDATSPKLQQLCCSGKHFSKLALDIQGRDYVLDDVSVVSAVPPRRVKGSPTLEREEISFTYQKIEYAFNPKAGAAADSWQH